MNCGIIQDLLALYHDGVCSPESRAAVEEHLQSCPECRAVLEFPSPYLRNAPTLVHLNENDPGGANREQIIQVSYEESFRCEWKAFAQSIFTGAVPESDGQGAVEDIRIASDIIKKAMLNR